MTQVEHMTAEDLLDDTIKYYGADPRNRRALDVTGKCVYHLERVDFNGGRECLHCAVGRWVEKPEILPFGTVSEVWPKLQEGTSQFRTRFKPAVAWIPKQFWTELQLLHDNDAFWDSNGLSEKGLRYSLTVRSFARRLDAAYAANPADFPAPAPDPTGPQAPTGTTGKTAQPGNWPPAAP